MSAKKPTTKKSAAKKLVAKKNGLRWSLGLFRNDRGMLVTVYVTSDGSPVPYLKRRVGGRKILFHRTYVGMPYSAARVQLRKDSRLKDQPLPAQKKQAA